MLAFLISEDLWKPNTDKKRNIFFLKRDKFYFQAEESRYG